MRLASFLAAAAGLALVPAAPAHAGVAAAGNLCSVSTWSPQAVVRGGPLAVAATPVDDPTSYPVPRVVEELPVDGVTDPVSVTLTCTIQQAMTHAHPDFASVSASGSDVVVLPPTPIAAPEGEAYVCTQLTVTDADGDVRDVYWDDLYDRFSADPASWCAPNFCTGPFPQGNCDTIFGVLFDLLFWTLDTTEASLCPVMPGLAPGVPGVVDVQPDGDLYVAGIFVWDCPPYES